MKKEKFGYVLKKILGGIKEVETTTYNDSGEVIAIKRVTTELSGLQIISK